MHYFREQFSQQEVDEEDLDKPRNSIKPAESVGPDGSGQTVSEYPILNSYIDEYEYN